MLDVGQVINSRMPNAVCVSQIEQLLESERELAGFARATYDQRMSEAHWIKSLKLELLLLYKWAMRRYLLSARLASINSLLSSEDHVVILLPSYGFALHALRRAVPFAALGVKTLVSVPMHQFQEAKEPLVRVAKRLGLQSALVITAEAPTDLVSNSIKKSWPIFLTGRKSTFESLKAQYPDARIYGATGSCSVIVSSNPESAKDFENRMCRHELSISCSNHGFSIVSDSLREDSKLQKVWGRAAGMCDITCIGDAIRRGHPSIILSIDLESKVNVSLIGGYTVWACGSDGEPKCRDGFGRDPIGGWPGDYLI